MRILKNLTTSFLLFSFVVPALAQLQEMGTLNEPVNIREDFQSFANTYYLANELKNFDPESASGDIEYNRYEYKTRQAFNNMLAALSPVEANEFPGIEYEASPNLPFDVDFVSPRTVRIRMTTGVDKSLEEPSLMLADGFAPSDDSWVYSKVEGGHKYTSPFGSITIMENPWRYVLRDENGKVVTSSNHHVDNDGKTYTPVMPFGYVRRAEDYSRSFSAA
ncbi:MAG TPA: hypothetical protein VJ909_09515, partial [Prolixibacteraceae bacterium]|nr:hypothetical protein [Prolixibacteraceae bacterium]